MPSTLWPVIVSDFIIMLETILRLPHGVAAFPISNLIQACRLVDLIFRCGYSTPLLYYTMVLSHLTFNSYFSAILDGEVDSDGCVSNILSRFCTYLDLHESSPRAMLALQQRLPLINPDDCSPPEMGCLSDFFLELPQRLDPRVVRFDVAPVGEDFSADFRSVIKLESNIFS